MRSFGPRWFLFLLVLTALAAAPFAAPQNPPASAPIQTPPTEAPEHLAAASNGSHLAIPFLPSPPVLEDFLSMRPEGSVAPLMAKVTDFIQRTPHDGQPVSQPTEAYLGYDNKNLYVVFVCHDQPGKVRGHETRREDFQGDDDVAVLLDTFHDRRRAYEFEVNPKGVQWDAVYTEASYNDTGGHFDVSFDTLWYSKGKMIPGGYIAWIAIPFRSLRFPSTENQTWGIVLLREVARENEQSFWPRIGISEEGRLAQAATATGIRGISPGRNIQLIPYGLLNGFHAVDDRYPDQAYYQNRDIGGTFGLDGKMILNDSLVLDVTANPDFSQVESDEPQVTVNQRYRVYFPEKRPFFIENGDYFRTPIDLFFTRNIVNPDAGVRLTGKAGPYSIGVLSADDRAPGLTVNPNDPLFKSRTYFTIARVSRDLFKQSSVGAIYTDWEDPAASTFNRVGGLDFRLKFSPHLYLTAQGVVSSSSYSYGSAYRAELGYTSNHWGHNSVYKDYTAGFSTVPGFVTRTDTREYRDYTSYAFRPKGGLVQSWGPEFFGHWTWDHSGLRLDTDYEPDLSVFLRHNTHFSLFPYSDFRERLRPTDYSGLTQDTDFHEHYSGINFFTAPITHISFLAQYFWGDAINFVPGFSPYPILKPYLARNDQGTAQLTLHPFNRLTIDNSYLFSRLRTRDTNANIFNNHILRTKWNWQFTRELSLRVILQYNATLTQNSPSVGADQFQYTYLPTSKNFNTDILFTYFLHPGTALYVGYNTNQQNLDPTLKIDPFLGGVHNGTRMINDGRLFFVKVSYLLRF